jgi:hypothetical protein
MNPKVVTSVSPSWKVLLVSLVAFVLLVGAGLAMAAEEEKNAPPRPTAKLSKVDRTESRIKQLNTELKITPAQEELWKAFVQVMRDNAKTIEEMNLTRAEKTATMNAVEDLKSYSDIVQAHAEGLKKYVAAFEALYASMSDEQKKNADVLFRGGKHHKGKRK